MKSTFHLTAFAICLILTGPTLAQTPEPAPAAAAARARDKAVYEAETRDPVLKEIRERNKAWDEDRDAATKAIRATQKERDEARKENRQVLRATLPAPLLPGTPDDFQRAFHFEPQAQFMTGTCWSYAATSFLEAEAFRLSGRKVKMSEMHTVYWEYVEKARRFVRERGDSHFAEGSQHNAVTRIWKQYGAVPLTAYRGVQADDGRHDHIRLSREMTAFLHHVKARDLWDEEWVITVIRSILDKYLGPPPTEFTFDGKQYTPRTFVTDYLQVDPDAYVGLMSTMKHPFHTRAEFEVPDNWWHDASYVNLPLDEWMAALQQAVEAGYSVAIGGDVSEPGKDFRQDVAFVPTFDIPADYIDQSAREYRIANGATGDDHGIHLVGWREKDGHTWFLIKDSGRSARHGAFPGYYFFRDDFVKLKMLTWMVHKDAVRGILDKLTAPAKADADSL